MTRAPDEAGRSSRASLEFVGRYIRRCRHFTGTSNLRCAAGVEYERFRERTGQLMVGQPIPPGYEKWHLPCFADDPDPWPCEKREARTIAEAEAYLAEADIHHKRYETVRFNIVAHAHEQTDLGVLPAHGISGRMPCPIGSCEGIVAYAIAPNHHITARCSGKCGTAWIE